MIRLLLGGSPCTHWSAAQKNNRETQPEGLGWELFKNYLIAKEKYKPDFFLYENNKSMANPIKAQISKELRVEPILINSALVSAQSRQRYYWANIPNVSQPKDREILVKDILENGSSEREKSHALDAHYANLDYTTWYKRRFNDNPNKQQHDYVFEPVGATQDGKAYCFAAKITEPVRLGHFNSGGQADRIYSIAGKTVCLSANGGGGGAKTGLYAIPADGSSKGHEVYTVKDGMIAIGEKKHKIKLLDGYYVIRKLTILECKRLQTVPDDYLMPCSATQNYKMLGNGWTVDVISHILSHIPNIKDEPIEVLSMYDGMSCGHIALDKLGTNIIRYYATEIDKYAIRTTTANYPDTIQLGDAFQVRDDMWRLNGEGEHV